MYGSEKTHAKKIVKSDGTKWENGKGDFWENEKK